jgi:16S rRNA (guanine527-N7)-methyltransferase
MLHNSSLAAIVSRETMEKLSCYVGLLEKWNKSINLISGASHDTIWERHILDSYQLIPFIHQKSTVLDVGSGGGLPAMVLAICHDTNITMVESDRRKALFLQEAIRELNLTNATIINQRIEAVSPQKPDIITARACAPLADFFSLITQHYTPSTSLYLLKGKNVHAEINVANAWDFDYTLHTNAFSDGYIIHITNLTRRS